MRSAHGTIAQVWITVPRVKPSKLWENMVQEGAGWSVVSRKHDPNALPLTAFWGLDEFSVSHWER